jgi:Icc-related predicted phosphoesterase
MSFRLAHISDTHGKFPRIEGMNIDAIVHSGDLPPDPDPSHGHKREIVEYWQRKWVWDHIEDFKTQIGNLPFLFVGGNHCHFGAEWFENELKSEGINAICLHDKVVSYGGLKWYGFPWVSSINGSHAHELNEEQMQEKIDSMVEAINASDYVDVIVAHQPPWQILDKDLRNGTHWGNKMMNDALFEKIDKEKLPQHYLTGHAHSSNGIRSVSRNERTILFSNAATTQHILELDY